MATTKYRETTVHTVGNPPAVGDALIPFKLTLTDLTEFNSAELTGRRVLLNVFPSIDTRVCALSVRRFNELAADLDNTTVVCISHDLPYAQRRFCGAEGIDAVVTASAFRSSFGTDYGLTMGDGAMAGLLARTVIVADAEGIVRHVQITESIGQEPDYDAALAALD